jgi:muramoyltetrapeptide carboxypeptidase
VVRPPRLRPGATIGVAAVSGPVEPDRLEAGVAVLERRGYRVVVDRNAHRRTGFLAA